METLKFVKQTRVNGALVDLKVDKLWEGSTYVHGQL